MDESFAEYGYHPRINKFIINIGFQLTPYEFNKKLKYIKITFRRCFIASNKQLTFSKQINMEPIKNLYSRKL